MPDASVSLGLNAAELYTEINTAVAKFQQGVNRMGGAAGGAAGSVNGLTGAHDRLFTSSHRVANRVGELARVFASGGSAADIMAVGIEGLGRSLNLPLGILAAIAATGVLVQQIYKTQTEAQRLKEMIASIGAGHVGNARFESLETLKTRAEEAKKKLEELKKAHDGVMATILRGIGSIGKVDKKDDEGYGDALDLQKKEFKRADQGQAIKGRQAVEIEETKLNKGEIAAERQKAKQKRDEAISAANAVDEEETRKQHRAVFVHDKETRGVLKDTANREQAATNAALDKKEAAQKREVDLEEKLTAIKRSGYDVDIRSAAAKMQYAKAALEAANAEQTRAAAAKVAAAAAEQEAAIRGKLESEAQDADSRHKQSVSNLKPGEIVTADQMAAREMAEDEEGISRKSAVARAEQEALAHRIGGRKPTLGEQAQLDEYAKIRGSGRQDDELKSERAALIRRQTAYNELKEREGENLGTEGNKKYEAVTNRIAQIDSYFKEASGEGKRERKEGDEAEIKRFGRILSPQEREQVGFQDQEAARQKGFQDQDKTRDQAASDFNERTSRGISQEQLENEREHFKGQNREDQVKNGANDQSKQTGDVLKDAAKDLKDAAGELKKSLTNQ